MIYPGTVCGFESDIIFLQESYERALVSFWSVLVKYSKWHFWPWWCCYRQHL